MKTSIRPDDRAKPTPQELALEVLNLTRDTLMVGLRFLYPALAQLPFSPGKLDDLATDGQSLFFDSQALLARYQKSREQVTRDYLHLILHLVLLHPFASHRSRPDYWNLACDLAVEAIIDELGLAQTECPGTYSRKTVFDRLKKDARSLTAEKLYRYFLNESLAAETALLWQEMVRRDEHLFWPCFAEFQPNSQEIDPDDRTSRQPDHETKDARQQARERWEAASGRIQVDLETFAQQWAHRSGSLTAAIERANQPRVDYRSFLRRFMVQGEALKINDEEFDLVFYTYGLARYHNLPLIEPLEYKDQPKIRDLVIAIDTSGSCRGETVQAFIRKTGAILSQEEAFFATFNVYLIQCDATVQSVTRLQKPEDFAAFEVNGQLCGFGGTDFRPVFQRVDSLIAENCFTKLKGLIYFTDGQGTFPEKKPAYETAFVFLKDDGLPTPVPPWAIKLVLHEEDLLPT